MKHTIKNSLAALLLLTMGVVGCSKEKALSDKQDPTNPTNPTNSTNTTKIPMSITVTDGGYTDSNPLTRTVENGYLTTFTLDDKIGLYVVKNGVIISENILLTHNGTGWTGDAYWGGADAKYFAYYPYQADIKSDLITGAETATEFFSEVISAWTPSTDQSTHVKYTSQDLMIGSGIVNERDGTYSLALTMTHAMGLVVIETPTKKYTFSNSDPMPEYWVPTPNITFYGFTPYSMSVGTHRYLVKPSQSNATNLVGSYIGLDNKTKEYIIPQNNIKAGNYNRFKVDGGINEVTHRLQAGDFYLKDGSLVSRDVKLSADQKASCIGIVYWVGDATKRDKTLKADHPDCNHGLVVAINGDVISTWQSSNISVQNWLNLHQKDKFLSVQTGTGANDPLNNIQGYNNTKAIEAYNASNNSTDYRVHGVQHMLDYRKTVPAPAISSDWYLPSAKELTLLCGKDIGNIWANSPVGTANRDLINQKLSLIGGSAQQLSTIFYWSSSELDRDEAFFVAFNSGSLTTQFKAFAYKDWCKVRSVLAF